MLLHWSVFDRPVELLPPSLSPLSPLPSPVHLSTLRRPPFTRRSPPAFEGLALIQKGHKVHFFTSHHDPDHCFAETRDGTLEVTVYGDWLPRHVFGYLHAVCKCQLPLVGCIASVCAKAM